jgi:hypothetical protein
VGDEQQLPILNLVFVCQLRIASKIASKPPGQAERSEQVNHALGEAEAILAKAEAEAKAIALLAARHNLFPCVCVCLIFPLSFITRQLDS